MISAEDRRYLYWLASECFGGFGHIVEMGPWLGGSTWCLAEGMRAGGCDTSKKLHVFDNFVWRDFMGGRGGPDLEDGACFEEHFLENLEPHKQRVVAHKAWLADEPVAGDAELLAIREDVPQGAELVTWPAAEPVEILFVDGAKSWQGMTTLLATFGDALVPGESLLVLQDYRYWGEYWVVAVAELLSDCLSLEHRLGGSTVTFRVTGAIDKAAIDRLPHFRDLDAGRCHKLIGQAGRRLRDHGDRLGELIVALTQLRMFVHKQDTAAAVEAFARIESGWPLLGCGANLEAARAWLRGASGDPLPPTARSRARRIIDRLLKPLRR